MLFFSKCEPKAPNEREQMVHFENILNRSSDFLPRRGAEAEKQADRMGSSSQVEASRDKKKKRWKLPSCYQEGCEMSRGEERTGRVGVCVGYILNTIFSMQ